MTSVLIETLWNVKFSDRPRALDSPLMVLIETLWNVKWQKLRDTQPSSSVLIETLWNVKGRRTQAALPA